MHAGDIMYFGNWNATHTAPLYLQKAPKDFADAMVVTQTEIDKGEAINVEGLAKADLDQFWASNKSVNAVVPVLVLKQPTGPQADVKVAANWTDGLWAMEIARSRVTTYPDESVQFSDLNQEYPFSLTISNAGIIGTDPGLQKRGGVLKFKP
jgi:hypothetical protein